MPGHSRVGLVLKGSISDAADSGTCLTTSSRIFSAKREEAGQLGLNVATISNTILKSRLRKPSTEKRPNSRSRAGKFASTAKGPAQSRQQPSSHVPAAKARGNYAF